jgi:hypothetical protein
VSIAGSSEHPATDPGAPSGAEDSIAPGPAAAGAVLPAPDPVRSPDVRALSLALSLGRVAIGAGLALAPRQSLAALGFREASDTTVAVSRIAGGRDLVMGAAAFAARDDRARLRAATLANAAVDACDVATFAAAMGAGRGSRGRRRTSGGGVRTAGVRGIAAALPATLAGLWVARRLS